MAIFFVNSISRIPINRFSRYDVLYQLYIKISRILDFVLSYWDTKRNE